MRKTKKTITNGSQIHQQSVQAMSLSQDAAKEPPMTPKNASHDAQESAQTSFKHVVSFNTGA